MELFKGYVLTKDKKCMEKFKGRTDFKTKEEVQQYDEYAGILADDVVLIDVDDAAQSEILMDIVEDLQLDCRVYQTTRGRHFLFKNDGRITSCGTGKKLACGLTADIKIGSRNSYSILKYKGEERFIEWDVEKGKDYQEAPCWLQPVNTKLDFFNLGAGDGRNDLLYKYILTLTGAGFSKDEARKTLNIINKWVFKDKLGEDEFETITRDEAFPEEIFFDGKVFLHNVFADFLKRNDHIKRINGSLHVYKDGVYVDGTRHIEQSIVKHMPTMKAATRMEVLKYLDIICPDNEKTADANLIAFKNGILDLETGELLNFTPEIVITNKIPWDYKAGAQSELADKTLNKLACHDEAIRRLLEECIGYCFYRRNEGSKAFILTGDKSNGKSTFLDMVKDLLGYENYSALDLSELDERFSVATMAGMLANIGDDISDEFLQGRSVAIFKKIVSGNHVKAEIKNDPNIFFMKPTVKLLFSANDIPRMKDKTGAVLRRLVIVPFNARFSVKDADFDPYIAYKLKAPEVMEYLVRIGVEGLQRVIANNDFTTSEKVQKELADYEIVNNPIMLFLQDKDSFEIENQPTKDVHKAYRVFCIENGFTEMTLTTFSKEICKRLNLITKQVRIKGERTRIFAQEE